MRKWLGSSAPSQTPCKRKKARLTVKRPLIRNIIHEQNPHSPPIICRGDGPEALLSCGVPYLQLDALAVELDGPDLEVDADGRDERGRERVLAEPQ